MVVAMSFTKKVETVYCKNFNYYIYIILTLTIETLITRQSIS